MNGNSLDLEMTKLTESVNSLKEAIKRQEKQISSYDINMLQNIDLIPNREFSEESKIGCGLYKTESGVSHWSWNVDSIHDMVDGMKKSLSSNEKQICRLMTENDGLKEDIKNKEQDLKKQKKLLTDERDAFEKFRRNTCNEVKRRKSKESEVKDNTNEKSNEDLSKLNSELTLFKQMYLEQTHSLKGLSRRVSNLKDDNKNLRNKLFQQETRSHKYILEAARRFDVKRKEFKELAKEKYAHETDHYRLVLYGIIEKNSSLAFDNSLLKFELDTLNQQLLEVNSLESLSETNNLRECRPETSEGSRKQNFDDDDIVKNNKYSSPFPAKSQASSLKMTDIVCGPQMYPHTLSWKKNSSNKLIDVDPWENTTETSEIFPTRTNSAPELGYGIR